MGWQEIRDGIHSYASSIIGAAYDALNPSPRDGMWTAIARGVWDEMIASVGQGVRVVYPQDWTGAAYEVAPVVGAPTRVLRRAQVHQAAAPATLTTGDPGTGRAWQNTARFVSGSISTGTATIVCDQTSTNYFGSTQTALALRLQTSTTVSPAKSRRIVLMARLGLTASAADTTAGICFRTGSLVRRAGIERTAGGYRVEWYTDSSGTGASLTNNPVWLAVVLSDTSTEIFYADSSSTTPPTSGWTQAHSSTVSPFPSNAAPDIAWCLIGVGSGGNFTGTLSYVSLGYSEEVAGVDDVTTNWPVTIIDAVEQPIEAVTSQEVASLQVAVPDDLEIADATMRSALLSGLLCSHGWAQSVEARWKRGGAPAGSWAGVSSQTSEGGTSGTYYIEIRPATSGDVLATQAFNIRLEAA